jgi:hypothetical protein
MRYSHGGPSNAQGEFRMISSDGADIFANPEELERYCAGITDRLQRRWQERSEFLSSAVERLRSLRQAAELMQEAELCEELGARIESASEELGQLEAAARDAGMVAVGSA